MGWAVEEFRHFVIVFLYLWALFGLFVMDQAVLQRQQGFELVFHGFAILNALILGKVMLVIEDLELARWLKARPLVWTILFEAVVCTFLFFCFHVVERLAVGVFHGASLEASLPSVGGGGLAGLLIVALIVFVSLLPFFAFKNLARAIGGDRMKEILFRKSIN
jgi:hypothetical protein